MKKGICYLGIAMLFISCSKNSSGPDMAEVWPKKGILLTTFADVGQTKKDTVYVKAVNVAEKRNVGNPSTITDLSSIWTISLHSDGSGQPSYVLIKNEDDEYLKIDSTWSPLGAKELILEIGTSTTPPNSYKFIYHKEPNGFRLESFHRKGFFLTSEGHSLGGNGLEFKSGRPGNIFWVHPK